MVNRHDVIYELSLNLSRILFGVWINISDICHIDSSYCNETKRSKILVAMNNLLIDGLKCESNA